MSGDPQLARPQFLTLDLPELEWLLEAHALPYSALGEDGALDVVVQGFPRTTPNERKRACKQMRIKGQLDSSAEPPKLAAPFHDALLTLAAASSRLAVSVILDGQPLRQYFFGRRNVWVPASLDPEGFHLGSALDCDALASFLCRALLAPEGAASTTPPPEASRIAIRAPELPILALFAHATGPTLSLPKLRADLTGAVPNPDAALSRLQRDGWLKVEGDQAQVPVHHRPWLVPLRSSTLGLELDRVTKKGHITLGLDIMGPAEAPSLLSRSKARGEGPLPGPAEFELLRISPDQALESILKLIRVRPKKGRSTGSATP